MTINEIVKDQRLYIDSEYVNLAENFCNLAGQEKTKTKERFILQNWYEGYIYTAMIGIKLNERKPRIGTLVDKAPKWSDNYIKQYKYILTKILSKPDIINELNLKTKEDIRDSFTSQKETIQRLKKICDEYSNGGLWYLQEQFKKDERIFHNYDSLKEIYLNATSEDL